MANISNVKVRTGNVLSLSGSSVEITGSQIRTTGDLLVNGTISASIMTISETVISSSVIHHSGNTRFGDNASDSHIFSGSVNISGTVSASFFAGDGSQLTNLTLEGSAVTSITAGTNLSASASTGAITIALTESITSGLVNLTASNISASNILRATTLSASNAEFSGSVLIYGTASLASNPSAAYVRYESTKDKILVFPGLDVSGSAIVSGNLEVTGAVSASSFTGSGASLTNLQLSALAGAAEGKIIIGSGSTFVTASLLAGTGITINSGSGVLSITGSALGVTAVTSSNSNITITNSTGPSVTASLNSTIVGLTSVSSNVVSASAVSITGSLSSLGSVARSRRTVTGNTTANSTDQVIFVNPAANTIITLPDPTEIDGREIVVKRVDNPLTAFTVDVSCSVNIDDANSFGLNGPMQSITLIADSGSVKWFIA